MPAIVSYAYFICDSAKVVLAVLQAVKNITLIINEILPTKPSNFHI